MRKFPHSAIVFLITLSIFSCQKPSGITGKLIGNNSNKTKAYLIKPQSLRALAASYYGAIIDSAVVSSNGSFQFSNLPITKDAILLEIALQKPGIASNYLNTENPLTSNYMPFVWQSDGPIQITAQINEFQKSFNILNPSKVNEEILWLRDINTKSFQTYLNGRQWDVEEGAQLLDKEYAIGQYREKLIEFANSTEYFLPAMIALRWAAPDNDFERIPEFLVNQCNKWNKKHEKHPWVEQVCKQAKPSKLPLLVGDKFPNFKLPMLTKDTITIKELLGKELTIIDLWASWCGPCRIENREVLSPIWEKYHSKGLQIIAYGLESDESAWKEASEHDGANLWPQASDLQGDDAAFLKKIRIQTIPANFILNSKGKILAKNLHQQNLINWVENYMKAID